MVNVREDKFCPCGSGKAYKVCHGAAKSNVIQMDTSRYENELERLEADLLSFAWLEYENELSDLAAFEARKYNIDDEEAIEVIMYGLLEWAILYQQYWNGHTLFEEFYRRVRYSIKYENVRKIFESWKAIIPSVYEVIDVAETSVTLKDRRSKEIHTLMNTEQDIDIDEVFIGILFPSIHHYSYMLILTPVVNSEMLYDPKHEIYQMNDKAFIENYPDILVKSRIDVQLNEVFNIEWADPLYGDVIKIAAERMKMNGAVSDHFFDMAIVIWKLYTEAAQPKIKKPEGFAAAIEFIVYNANYDEDLPKAELAREYGVAVSTVTNNINKMMPVLVKELTKIQDELNEII
ncbi:SEC-C domain-containing protein [Oceanobacillus alkalisoli]|uniref:SEC-C domain-containing protein n=1 Tax=Oceanobacillus alkalisoli TaxID=2925113 RepID=UPI001EF03A7C|nr:SEC-C domain-containing protein [Oceanobacillus alkalisoli]MCF3944382.1 SEC-C domain-containing protein [Oceanobacillus alkalisoli]MCG5102157.1 SEC-C domain-containing protein [Oceanobacillus alkalisoli]